MTAVRCLMIVLILLVIWVGYSLFTFPIIRVFGYESACGKFDDFEVPAKGRTLDDVQRRFTKHKANCNQAGHILYRTTARNWSNCFNWPDNLNNKRWSIPYKRTEGR